VLVCVGVKLDLLGLLALVHFTLWQIACSSMGTLDLGELLIEASLGVIGG